MASLGGYLSQGIAQLYADPKALAAAVTGGATAYAGGTAAAYNKENFSIDEENRFTRFAASRANMCAQVGQYRFDIRGLTNVTVTKAHVFLDTAQLFMCTSAALSCAGRIGMHGSAPPGWLCALYTGHIFLGAMYLTVSMWLGFHCNLRAQCGMVSLLTRKVRLPIPSLQQINGARVFGSSYEKQKWWDVLRFPWVSHPFDAPEIPGASSDEDEGEEGNPKGKTIGKKKAKQSQEHEELRQGDYAASDAYGSTGRASVPSWIRDEQVVDKGKANVPRLDGENGIRYDDPHEVPDHFRIFTEAQKEWFPYETYHKIAMTYGVMCFFHAVCYYCIIYAMSELRGFWIAWAVPSVFMTCQYWLLQLDIFKAHGQQMLRGFEFFGHVAPYFACAAATCEYRFQYSHAQVGLAWTFAIACLTCHMLFACRFWDLMTPDTMAKEMDEEDCKAWWPKSWPMPLAFANTTWQLTPPAKLKKGQHDLLHEAINLERQGGGVCKVRRRRGKDGKTGQKQGKRQMAQNPTALLAHSSELEHRFRSGWEQVVGKDQVKLQQIYGSWVQANREAQSLMKEIGGGGSSDSGSGSEGSSGSSGGKLNKGASVRLGEVAESLNHIEEELGELERQHQVIAGNTGAKRPGSIAQTIETGTSPRGLPETPYWIMRATVGTHIFIWFFIIVCTSVEIIMGTEAMFAPPGEPPWIRNQKMRPYQPDKEFIHLSTDPLPSWYRLFTASVIPDPDSGEHSSGHGAPGGHAASTGHGAAAAPAAGADHGAGGHRRLDGVGDAQTFNDLFSQLPALDWLAQEYLKDEGMEKPTHPAEVAEIAGMPTEMPEEFPAVPTSSVPMGGFMTHSLQTLPVDWPPLFEPRHLACQTRASGAAIAALTARGFGALLHVKNSSDVSEGRLAAQQFALAGISSLGPLVGASWGTTGLHLVTKAGHLLHCPGHAPTDGAWPCQAASGPPAPMSPGAMLRAGAVSEHASGRTLALLFEDMPKTVVMYKEHVDGRSWLPAGEVHLPPRVQKAALGFSGDSLMMVGEDGAVHHRPLRDGVSPSFIPAPATSVPREWHAACAASAMDGGIVRLALRQNKLAWHAELVVSGKTTPLVNV